MRERLVVEDVPEPLVERVVGVGAHLQQAVLDPEGVAIVIARGVVADLDRPALEVASVEQLAPRGAVGPGPLGAGRRDEGHGRARGQQCRGDDALTYGHGCLR